MPRTGPSDAERAMIDQLVLRGASVSAAQLERWRSAGVLPRNARLYLGRGRGTASSYTEAAVDMAEALALAVRRGRSIHEAVLRIFTANPRLPDLFEHPGLPIPESALRRALDWFVRVGERTLDRRIERTLIRHRTNSTDEAADLVIRLVLSHYAQLRHNPDPTSSRRPDIWKAGGRREAENAAALAVARHLGQNEIGADRFAEIVLGLFQRQEVAADDREYEQAKKEVRKVFEERDFAGEQLSPAEPWRDATTVLKRLALVPFDEILAVREQIACVAGMGDLFLDGYGAETSMSERMLDATTKSLEVGALFHMIVPIAKSLNTDAWHRLSSLLIDIVTEGSQEQAVELSALAAAAIPWRFKLARKRAAK